MFACLKSLDDAKRAETSGLDTDIITITITSTSAVTQIREKPQRRMKKMKVLVNVGDERMSETASKLLCVLQVPLCD